MARHRILFICMGNICRSPTAEGVFRKLADERGLADLFEIDSAGTGSWHVGSTPDHRARQTALARNIDLSRLRARQITADDITYYDSVIAMDYDNLAQLKSLAAERHHRKIRLLMEYAESSEMEVPDPYYGGDHGFDLVLDMIEEACKNLLTELTRRRP